MTRCVWPDRSIDRIGTLLRRHSIHLASRDDSGRTRRSGKPTQSSDCLDHLYKRVAVRGGGLSQQLRSLCRANRGLPKSTAVDRFETLLPTDSALPIVSTRFATELPVGQVGTSENGSAKRRVPLPIHEDGQALPPAMAAGPARRIEPNLRRRWNQRCFGKHEITPAATTP